MRTDDPGTAAGRLARLEAAVRRARLALAWERLWPLLVPPLSVAGLFLALSWFGYWRIAGDRLRLATLAVLALLLVGSLLRFIRFALPSRGDAMRRVERVSELPHRPASGLADRLSPVADDGPARALWEAHRRRLLAAVTAPRAGAPQPRMAHRDPNALRFAVPVLLVVAFAMAWGEWGLRLGEAFTPVAPAAPAAPARIDAWIDPPAYTRQAPVSLSRRSADAAEPVRVPEGSKLTVRVVSAAAPAVALDSAGSVSALQPAEPEAPPAAGVEGGERIRTYAATLSADAVLSVRHGGRETRYAVAVVEDRPPTIERGPMTPNLSGSFRLDFTVADDYGVTGGKVVFRRAGKADPEARPLVAAPEVALRIGRAEAGKAGARAEARLEEHPYAGLAVAADAVVTDAAGQEGRPADRGEMTLPARPFRKPLARALVEQRQILALDARAQDRVAQALDALSLAPERFLKDGRVYLGLRVGYHRLAGAASDDELRDVLDYLWAMARAIEDGLMADAEDRLDAAREALEKALAEGASEEEIARLMDELRQAMQDYLQSMMEEMARQGQDRMPAPLDPDARMLSQQDLERMLDRIEDLARLGDRDAARDLLAELQQMLDNLQMAERGQMQDGASAETMEMMEELSRIMREQQRLMDDTFRLDQGQRPRQRGQDGRPQPGEGGEQRPLTPSEMAEIMRRLQQGQGDLQENLQALLDRLQQGQQGEQGQPGAGTQPGEGEGEGDGERALGRAGRAMGEAEGALGGGRTGDAFGRQGEAMEALRQGLEGMMQQMFGNQGPPQQVGRGQPRGRTDPLGRPQRADGPDFGDSVDVPDEIDVERARRILEAIRERLGERNRPRFELDYLERLLRSQ